MPEPAAPEPQGQAGIHRRLITGTAGKMMTLAINFGEQILLVPVFLYFWGPDRFADWTVLLAAAAMLTMADLGLQSYYGNAFQIALSRNHKTAFSKLLDEAIALYGMLVAAGAAAILTLGVAIDWQSALNLSAAGTENVGFVFILLGAHFIVMLPFGVKSAIYRAYGDFTLSIMAGNFLRLGLISLIVAGLAAGAAPLGVAALHLVAALGAWIAVGLHQKRRYRDLRYGIRLPDRAALRDLFSVAPLYAFVLLATMFTTHGTVFLISALAPSGAAAALLYRTVRTLIGMIRLIPDQIMHVTGVEIARQYAQDDTASLGRTLKFFSRFAGGLCGGFAGMLAFIAPPFFPIWTLNDIAFDGAVFWPLLAAAALAGPSLAGTSVLLFINRPAGMAGAHIAAGVMTLILCAALIPEMGGAGAAWAVLAAEALILSTVIPWQTARILSVPPLRMILLTHLYTALAFIVSAACAWAGVMICGSESIFQLVLAGILWILLAGVPAFLLLFDGEQRRWITNQVLTRAGLRHP